MPTISTMPFLSPEAMRTIFENLSQRPNGHIAFFQHVADDVIWQITGHNVYSGTWTSKKQFLQDVWLPMISCIADPGLRLDLISYPEDQLSTRSDSIVVELETSDTKTKLGAVPYHQTYCWHCQFNGDGKIARVKEFMDSSTAERVLGEECARQNREAIQDPIYPKALFDFPDKDFLQQFYMLVDAPHEHERYVNCFAPDATLVLGTKSATGRAEISKIRRNVWTMVKKMAHTLIHVCHYPYSDFAMVHGFVDYEFINGVSKRVDWAAQCHFKKAEAVFLERYQVYLAENIASPREARV